MKRGEERREGVRREEDFDNSIKDLIGYETLFGKGGKSRGEAKDEEARKKE